MVWIPVQGIPAADLEQIIPLVRVWAGAKRHELAARIAGAAISEVVVPPSVIYAFDDSPEIAFQLLVPEIDEVLGVDLDRFNLADGLKGDDDPSDHCGVARYSATLQGPAIAQELGSQVPFFCPISFQALSSFFVSYDGPLIPDSEQIESPNVDKGITTSGVSWHAGHVKGDREREFK